MHKYIFVYGTLMEGFSNYEKYLKGNVIERRLARTKGKLYHLIEEGYPAMIDGEDDIYGELILIKNFTNILKQLDELECYYGEDNENNEYNRVLKEVQVLEDNTICKAYMYAYNYKDIQSLKKSGIYLPHGDWRKYIEANKIKAI